MTGAGNIKVGSHVRVSKKDSVIEAVAVWRVLKLVINPKFEAENL